MKTVADQVSISLKDETGKDVSFVENVSYVEFESVDDVLNFLSNGNSDAHKSFITAANYGTNLKARASVRAAIIAKYEGPGKAIDNMIKQYIKTRAAVGKPVTEEQAKTWAQAQLA